MFENLVLCQNSAQPASTIKLRSRNHAKLQHANGLRGGHEHLTAEAPIGGAVACPFIIIVSRHPEHQRGHRPAQRASGQALSLSCRDSATGAPR